jgi:hypothetical protein
MLIELLIQLEMNIKLMHRYILVQFEIHIVYLEKESNKLI